MATKLYVGNLSYSTTEDDLRSLFEEVGAVASCDVILDRFTSKSRGFAFVEMATHEDAQNAIAQCHNKEFQGRNLVVNEARPREERGPREGRGGPRDFGGGDSGYSSSPPPSRKGSGKGSRRGIRNAKRGGDGFW